MTFSGKKEKSILDFPTKSLPNTLTVLELLDVYFRQKMLSGPKDRSFTPPENLSGEGLKHTFIRENGDSPLFASSPV